MKVLTNRSSNINRRIFLGLAASAATGLISSSFAQNKKSIPNIKRHTAAADGFHSNSTILTGTNSTTLIDAQLIQREAEEVIDIIKSTGKPLENIIITHSHIDHYAGLEFIGPAFPKAIIYSAEKTIQQITESSNHWPTFTSKLAVMSSGRYRFSDFDMDCLVLPDAESESPLVLFLPEKQILISGDHVLRDQHLWLAEGRLDQWLRNLDNLEDKWEIQRVFPGHGEPGGVELIDAVRQYIRDFQRAVETSEDPEIAKQKILRIYPDYRLKDVLEISLLSVYSN